MRHLIATDQAIDASLGAILARSKGIACEPRHILPRLRFANAAFPGIEESVLQARYWPMLVSVRSD